MGLILYSRPTCYFCSKVRRFADEHNITIKYRDIENNQYKEELIALGGKKMVPFLVDEEKDTSMYESNDIIEYLKKEYTDSMS